MKRLDSLLDGLAIQWYFGRLTPVLYGLHGALEFYSTEQVSAAIRHSRLWAPRRRVAFAMFSGHAEYESLPGTIRGTALYPRLRVKIKRHLFGDEGLFNGRDLWAAWDRQSRAKHGSQA